MSGCEEMKFGMLVQLLTQLSTVGLYWGPGHVGVRGNDIAGQLARDGSVSDQSLSWVFQGRT